ncbi:hypothetical protein V5O48_018804, partial [Marasmius crinis-equi]
TAATVPAEGQAPASVPAEPSDREQDASSKQLPTPKSIAEEYPITFGQPVEVNGERLFYSVDNSRNQEWYYDLDGTLRLEGPVSHAVFSPVGDVRPPPPVPLEERDLVTRTDIQRGLEPGGGRWEMVPFIDDGYLCWAASSEDQNRDIVFNDEGKLVRECSWGSIFGGCFTPDHRIRPKRPAIRWRMHFRVDNVRREAVRVVEGDRERWENEQGHAFYRGPIGNEYFSQNSDGSLELLRWPGRDERSPESKKVPSRRVTLILGPPPSESVPTGNRETTPKAGGKEATEEGDDDEESDDGSLTPTRRLSEGSTPSDASFRTAQSVALSRKPSATSTASARMRKAVQEAEEDKISASRNRRQTHSKSLTNVKSRALAASSFASTSSLGERRSHRLLSQGDDGRERIKRALEQDEEARKEERQNRRRKAGKKRKEGKDDRDKERGWK